VCGLPEDAARGCVWVSRWRWGVHARGGETATAATHIPHATQEAGARWCMSVSLMSPTVGSYESDQRRTRQRTQVFSSPVIKGESSESFAHCWSTGDLRLHGHATKLTGTLTTIVAKGAWQRVVPTLLHPHCSVSMLATWSQPPRKYSINKTESVCCDAPKVGPRVIGAIIVVRTVPGIASAYAKRWQRCSVWDSVA
jgi:hypothetical protein